MNRPVQWASASGRPVQWASASGRPVQWASASGRPVQWTSARSRSPLRESSSIVQGQGASIRSWVASSRGKYPVTSFSRPVTSFSRNKTLNGAGSRGQHSSKRLSPHGVSSRSRPADRGGSPQTSSSRYKTHGQPSKRSPSPQGAISRSPSPQGAVSRSMTPWGASRRILSPQQAPSRNRPIDSGKCPLTSSSRKKPHNGAGSRGRPPKRSPSPQGAVSRSPSPQGAVSRSPSPQGASSRSPSPQGFSSRSGNRIAPSVTIDQNSEDEDGVSATSPGADADHTALSSHEPPDGLYGVKVSNFHFRLKSKRVKSCLTEHFTPYGNVVCVTMHGSDMDRYGLVFYKLKHEREKALKADTNGPLEMKLCITPWSGPSPCIFGIVVTDIKDTLDVPDRIRSEFSIFGDIDSVMFRGLVFERFVVVFYKDRKGQEKALTTQNPFKTSFGEVTLHAWNRPPPSQKEMSNNDILMAVGYSSDVAMLAPQ
ncbi:uncharacterized protein [Ambystoma mexicanum]|uniref:uncharacterized protein n=1 Tax=Ambystoma mexicanum TaxID=8296 RepID=UPI0037E84F59